MTCINEKTWDFIDPSDRSTPVIWPTKIPTYQAKIAHMKFVCTNPHITYAQDKWVEHPYCSQNCYRSFIPFLFSFLLRFFFFFGGPRPQNSMLPLDTHFYWLLHLEANIKADNKTEVRHTKFQRWQSMQSIWSHFENDDGSKDNRRTLKTFCNLVLCVYLHLIKLHLIAEKDRMPNTNT